MRTPPFALPDPDLPDATAGSPPAAVGARQRALRLCSAASLGAAASAATLAVAATIVGFESAVTEALARPASIPAGVGVAQVRELAELPGPSPLLVAALLPAAALLLLACALRRLGRDAAPPRRVSAEALSAAERTMAWAARVVVAGALPVFVLPALLQLAGLQVFSLTTGSMAPAHPAGSLVIAARPPTSAAVPVGAVVLIDIPGGMHVTHRVVALVRDDAGALVAYRTRGDAVAETDPLPVARASITGLVVGGVPILGSLRAWMASPLGIALGVVLVCAFTLLSTLLGDDRRRVEVALAGDAGRR